MSKKKQSILLPSSKSYPVVLLSYKYIYRLLYNLVMTDES